MEMQTKIIMSYYYTSTRMTKNPVIIPNAGEVAEKLHHSYTGGRNAKCIDTLENSLKVPLKSKIGLTVQPSNYTLGCSSQRNENFHAETCMPMFRAVYL